MGSVLQIGDRWRAQVRRAGHKSKSKTFGTKREAEQWARRLEAALDQEENRPLLADEITVGELVAEFRRMRDELGRPVMPTTNTHYMLEHLVEDLGANRVRDLTSDRLVKWARQRQREGAGGYTVNMELSQLGTVIRHTAGFLKITLPDVVGAARPLLMYGQLITGGTRRSRRPTADELARLLPWIQERNPVACDAIRVGIITGMRRGELARIQFGDIDEARKAVLVRKRKHPRAVEARDEWVPLLGEAWGIVKRQPQSLDGRIFQVSREALTDCVTHGTLALGIPDLHLHDMRREATSRLRELGFDQHARKAITGHLTDEAHDIYVAVTLESLHEQFDAAQGKRRRQPRPPKAGGRQT